MGCKVDPVCPECTRKCRFLHGKGKSSSLLPTSFFKIMLGDDFSEYMYVPPKFNRTVPDRDLLDKKIILEDSRGEQWKVTVSFVDGSVAFNEGWNAFSLDHGLKIGDFLIFNYTSESHFDVWIYDDSACNKLDFSKKRNQKKRSRDRNDSSVKDGLLVRQGLKASVVSMPDVPKMKRQHREVDLGGTQNNAEKFSNYGNINGRAQSVCIEDYHEDPCYMTSRGLGETERDDKTFYDDSACNKLDFSKKRNQKKRSRDRNDSSVKDGLLVRQGLKASVVSMPDVPKMKRQHREVDLGGTQNNTEKFSNYGNINGRAQSVCIEDYHEDPCYMTSRGLGETERDDKTSKFDVLDCEILNNCGVNGTRKVATVDSNVSHVDYLFKRILGRGAASDPSELELPARNHSLELKDSSAYDKNCTLKLEENSESISIMSNREVRECQFTEGLDEMLKITEKKHVDNYMTPNDCTPMWTNSQLMSQKTHCLRHCEQVVISQKTHASHIDSFYNTNQIFNGIPNISDTMNIGVSSQCEMLKMTEKKHVDMTPNVCSFEDKLHATGPMSDVIKKEIVDEITPNMCKDELPATGEMSKRIKSELQDMTVYKDELLLATGSSKAIKRESRQISQPFNEDSESHSQTAATVSCVVPIDDDSFLGLPAPLSLSNKRGIKKERLVVYLRDQLTRLWPVFYHEQSNFCALTEGWSEYRKANNIQPRDVCIFRAENKSNRIFVVDIVHK